MFLRGLFRQIDVQDKHLEISSIITHENVGGIFGLVWGGLGLVVMGPWPYGRRALALLEGPLPLLNVKMLTY